MNQKTAWQRFSNLPPEAQQQVVDFIAFLQTRHVPPRSRKPAKLPKLAKEPFVGMWRHRADLKDSTKWVRNMREREWGKR
jgi:hypothetical protein